MGKLIWFSIPGAIVIISLLAGLKRSDIIDFSWLLIAGTPVIGFIVHQVSRTIFEFTCGFDGKWRRVISEIMKKYSFGNDNKTAFLVWELTFYSDCIPESFRDHDRNIWHYIMSFLSIIIAVIIAILFVLYKYNSYFIPYKLALIVVVFFVIVFIIFWCKIILSLKNIEEQEISLLTIHDEQFKKNAEKLKNRKSFLEEDSRFTTDKIGGTAGQIYEFINGKKGFTLLQLETELNLPGTLVRMGIGWLAREDKLNIDAKKDIKVSLK